MSAPAITTQTVTLRCTDGRSAEIPDWLYAEYHRAPYHRGRRCDPFGPAIRSALHGARHHSRGTFDCAVALAETAEEIATRLALIVPAHRVKK